MHPDPMSMDGVRIELGKGPAQSYGEAKRPWTDYWERIRGRASPDGPVFVPRLIFEAKDGNRSRAAIQLAGEILHRGRHTPAGAGQP